MAAPLPAPPRFVELIRVSSQGQAARDTPADQRAALDRLRLARPGTAVARIEQQVSGAAAGADRPDLARLAELAALRAFDEVRVRHLDRLTRHEDPLERAAVLSMVRRAGAVIVDAGGAVLDPATMGGELVWVVSTLASAEERRKILERTSAAKARLAREGRLVHGRPPFGRTFDRASGRWGIDRVRADFYRRVAELVLAGRSLREVSRLVAGDGPPCPLGGSWSATRLQRMLVDRTATGTYRTHGATFQIPAITTKEEQAAVVARLHANNSNKSGRPAKVFALLRRLAVCGACGAPIYTSKGGKFRNPHHYYTCSSRGPCRKFLRLDVYDELVWAKVLGWLQRPDTLEAAAEVGGPPPVDFAAVAAAAERDLARLAREELNVARLLSRGQIQRATGDGLLAEVARRRASAELELQQLRLQEEAEARRQETAESLEATLAAMRAGAATAAPEERAAIMGLLFPRGGVVLYPTGRVELRGILALDAPPPGSAKPSPSPRRGIQIPVRLSVAGRR